MGPEDVGVYVDYFHRRWVCLGDLPGSNAKSWVEDMIQLDPVISWSDFFFAKHRESRYRYFFDTRDDKWKFSTNNLRSFTYCLDPLSRMAGSFDIWRLEAQPKTKKKENDLVTVSYLTDKQKEILLHLAAQSKGENYYGLSEPKELHQAIAVLCSRGFVRAHNPGIGSYYNVSLLPSGEVAAAELKRESRAKEEKESIPDSVKMAVSYDYGARRIDRWTAGFDITKAQVDSFGLIYGDDDWRNGIPDYLKSETFRQRILREHNGPPLAMGAAHDVRWIQEGKMVDLACNLAQEDCDNRNKSVRQEIEWRLACGRWNEFGKVGVPLTDTQHQVAFQDSREGKYYSAKGKKFKLTGAQSRPDKGDILAQFAVVEPEKSSQTSFKVNRSQGNANRFVDCNGRIWVLIKEDHSGGATHAILEIDKNSVDGIVRFAASRKSWPMGQFIAHESGSLKISSDCLRTFDPYESHPGVCDGWQVWERTGEFFE